MKKILYLIPFILLLNSCGKSVDVQPDKYPNIPEFPKFENDVLKLSKMEQVVFNVDSTFSGNFETRYLVKDSLLAIITFTTNSESQLRPQKGDKYIVNLTVINNEETINTQRIDDDFRLNFKIDSASNIIIGKYKYLSENNYFKVDSIPNLKKEDWVDDKHTFEYKDKTFYKPDLFESIAVASNTEIEGAQNTPIFVLKKVPIFMNYYKIKCGKKVGLTKVRGGYLPEIITVNDDLYYADKVKSVKKNRCKMNIYKIE